MEPITHFLTGACIGRAGFNRKTACATVVATLAAEAADLDVFWGIRGPVEELKHHRGITHTFLGAPFVALVIVAISRRLLYLAPARPPASPNVDSIPASPACRRLRWGWLYLTALVAAFSHILLDWTNNYGVRPFFPFNPRWYEGSFMFIAEPVLWGIFLIALVLPWLFGLADREIGARRTPFRGPQLGHLRPHRQLHRSAAGAGRSTPTPAPCSRTSRSPPRPSCAWPSSPILINPWRWHAILETPALLPDRRSQHPHRHHRLRSPDRHALQAGGHARRRSRQTHLPRPGLSGLGHRGPWCATSGQSPSPASPRPTCPRSDTWTTVEFTDLRFAYAFRRGGSFQSRVGPHRLGLHRGQSRRRRRIHGRPRTEMT